MKLEYKYDLINIKTVLALVNSGDVKLPVKKVNELKDMAWNNKIINSQILQGLLGGETMDEIADRLMNVTDSCYKSAIRNARTMVTGAENLGRQKSLESAKDDGGIITMKEWIATDDERTRESHMEIDGETVEVDDIFSNGCEYPGDSAGPADEVWNCRCSMGTKVVGFIGADGKEYYIDEEIEYESDDY